MIFINTYYRDIVPYLDEETQDALYYQDEDESTFTNVPLLSLKLGMISHKKSLITNFGHNHKIKNLIRIRKKIIKEISAAFNFGLYLK